MMALVLAGGRGTRLKELTDWRVKPAVPFGGKYRIIDFVLSNCVNSGIRRVGILTQYKSQSLIRHVMKGWELFHPDLDEFIECIPAQKKRGEDWYCGTANAVFQNLDLLHYYKPEHVIVLAGDHIYRMDYRHMLAFHMHHNADLTIASTMVPTSNSHCYGVLSINEENQVIEFAEKPDRPESLPGFPGKSLVSMGIYIFNTGFLIQKLIEDNENISSSHDFGMNIIPEVAPHHRVFAYPFYDLGSGDGYYWRDVGTVDSYWHTSMELIGVSPEFNLYDLNWPIRTASPHYPPAKFVFNEDKRRGTAVDSIVSEGCIVSGARVEHSILSLNVRVEEGSLIKDSIVLPNVSVGSHCDIQNAIIDKECRIPW